MRRDDRPQTRTDSGVIQNGRMKLTLYLRPDRYLWLKALSLERVIANGGGRPDASTLIEGIIDLYRDGANVGRPTAAKKTKRKKR